MKTIGIIGGMSYESSIHYYERINKQVNMQESGLTSAKIIMYSVNFGEIRPLMLEDKWDEIGLILSDIAKKLENMGADYIAIATNTMHKLADVVQNNINVPLIHIADCVATKCNDSKIKNVGLLGTRYTMEQVFLKERLSKNGLIVSVPTSKDEINEIDRIIFEELCNGIIKDTSRNYFIDSVNNMIQKNNIEGVILGCTEIEMLLRSEDVDVPLFDTTQSHIDTLVECSLSKRI